MQWRIGALTFNVNNRQCNANSVEILLSEVLKHNEENVDVVVVSLQVRLFFISCLFRCFALYHSFQGSGCLRKSRFGPDYLERIFA